MPSSRIVLLRVMMYGSLCVLVLVRHGPKISERTAPLETQNKEEQSRGEEKRERDARARESLSRTSRRENAERTSVSDG